MTHLLSQSSQSLVENNLLMFRQAQSTNCYSGTWLCDCHARFSRKVIGQLLTTCRRHLDRGSTHRCFYAVLTCFHTRRSPPLILTIYTLVYQWSALKETTEMTSVGSKSQYKSDVILFLIVTSGSWTQQSPVFEGLSECNYKSEEFDISSLDV